MQVIARDAALNRLGVIPFTGLQLVLRHLGVSSWQLQINADHPKASLLTAGGGIIVEDDTGTVLSGPCRIFGVATDDNASGATLTVSGVSDDYLLAARLVYPDPTQPADNQIADAYDIRSGVGETVMKGLVDDNTGPSAILARRSGLTIEVDNTRGATVSSSARFDNLLDVLSTLGSAAGLGFQTVQVGSAIVFDVYEPADLTTTARFSTELGNLRGYSYELDAPNATRVIVAGQGEGTARTFIERSDTTAEADWSTRVEVFQDRRDTDDLPTLQQAGDETLADQGPATKLALSPVDTPRMRFREHYNRGDKVTVEIPGGTITDVVTQINLQIDDGGTQVVPVVGDNSGGGPGTPRIFQQVSDLARRVGLLEQRR